MTRAAARSPPPHPTPTTPPPFLRLGFLPRPHGSRPPGPDRRLRPPSGPAGAEPGRRRRFLPGSAAQLRVIIGAGRSGRRARTAAAGGDLGRGGGCRAGVTRTQAQARAGTSAQTQQRGVRRAHADAQLLACPPWPSAAPPPPPLPPPPPPPPRPMPAAVARPAGPRAPARGRAAARRRRRRAAAGRAAAARLRAGGPARNTAKTAGGTPSCRARRAGGGESGAAGDVGRGGGSDRLFRRARMAGIEGGNRGKKNGGGGAGVAKRSRGPTRTGIRVRRAAVCARGRGRSSVDYSGADLGRASPSALPSR